MIMDDYKPEAPDCPVCQSPDTKVLPVATGFCFKCHNKWTIRDGNNHWEFAKEFDGSDN